MGFFSIHLACLVCFSDLANPGPPIRLQPDVFLSFLHLQHGYSVCVRTKAFCVVLFLPSTATPTDDTRCPRIFFIFFNVRDHVSKQTSKSGLVASMYQGHYRSKLHTCRPIDFSGIVKHMPNCLPLQSLGLRNVYLLLDFAPSAWTCWWSADTLVFV